MKRQFAVFVLASILIGVLAISLMPQVLADAGSMFSAGDGLNTVIALKSGAAEVPLADLSRAVQVVQQRLSSVEPNGQFRVTIDEAEKQLQVALSGDMNTPYTLDVITHVGQVEFIDGGADSPPIGRQVRTGPAPAADDVYQTLFIGKDIRTIAPPENDTGEIFYQLSLVPPAAERFKQVMAKGNNYLCLVIDGKVTNCSKMYHLSGQTIDILPELADSTGLNLADLAVFLASGPLPVPVEVVN
jgi:hypothetical protein